MKNVVGYLEHLKQDYKKWAKNLSDNSDQYGHNVIRERMTREFCDGLCVREGKKYIRVFTNNGGSVHSFIVKSDGKKFQAGDILKAASYAAPALNFARGNVLRSEWSKVTWTGAQ